MSKLIVGVDVGGSSTHAVVSDGTTVLARAAGPGAAVRPGRALVSAATITEVIRRALSAAEKRRCDRLVVGAAGAGRETEREELRQALRSEDVAASVVVLTDIEIALAAAFGKGPGIVVTAGTGSIAVARDGGSKLRRSGGYGWQMGDEGSGYAIGRGALGAVGRSADERGPATALTTRLLRETRSDTFDALVRWAAKATPAEVAALAPAVLDEAARGDAASQGIVDYATRELCQLVLHLLPFFRGTGPVSVAMGGGLLQPGRPLHAAVRQRLAEQPDLIIEERPLDPPLGAVFLALDQAD